MVSLLRLAASDYLGLSTLSRGAVVAGSVIFEERVEIPLTLRSLADFRGWAQSEGLPERGRIDYISGRIEVDMSPEDLFCV